MSSIRYNTIFKLETMTTLSNQLLENIKNQNIMYSLALLFSMLLTLNATANTNKNTDTFSECKTGNIEECTLNKILFANNKNTTTNDLDISTIEVVNIEEEVTINFNTKNYLPEGFNALKGKDDLDFSVIELNEIEEEIELDFDTKQYLPKGFNPLKGKWDLDFSTIELIQIEEDDMIGFNTKDYLPKGFNALKGKDDLDWSKIEIIEIEEELDLNSTSNIVCTL